MDGSSRTPRRHGQSRRSRTPPPRGLRSPQHRISVVGSELQATLVFPSGSNQNHRIEFPEPDGRGDPKPERTLLVVLERSFRTFRYMSLRRGDAGYPELRDELAAREALGAARKPETKRVLLSYGKLRAAWPGRCPLRP